MRRFFIAVLIVIAMPIPIVVGQFGWSVYQATGWSHALWQQVERGPGAEVDLARLGPLSWDRVYVFGPYTSNDYICQSLGFRWPDVQRTTIQFSDGVNLLVFLRGGKVVGWFEHGRDRGDFADAATRRGYSHGHARFRARLDANLRLVLLPE